MKVQTGCFYVQKDRKHNQLAVLILCIFAPGWSKCSNPFHCFPNYILFWRKMQGKIAV